MVKIVNGSVQECLAAGGERYVPGDVLTFHTYNDVNVDEVRYTAWKGLGDDDIDHKVTTAEIGMPLGRSGFKVVVGDVTALASTDEGGTTTYRSASWLNECNLRIKGKFNYAGSFWSFGRGGFRSVWNFYYEVISCCE